MNNDHSVFVAHCDYGKKGFEAIVDLAATRQEIVSKIAKTDFGFDNVIRVDEYNAAEGWSRDITDDIMIEVERLRGPSVVSFNRQAAEFDHQRDLRKHEVA